MDELKTCFVIAPIGESDSEIRKRSDQVLKHIITPPVKECGFEPLRADQISEPGMITSQIIQHIINDPLIIADLTGRNPNVFYEVAIRHAIQKPLVQIIGRGEQIPFDVAATRVIVIDYQDLDSVEEAKTQIAKQIRAVTKDPSKVDSPISSAINLQSLKQSDAPEQRSLADIIETISEMNLGIKKIQNVLQDDAVLQDKRKFRDVSLIIEKIRMRSYQAADEFRNISEWAVPEDLDEKEKTRRILAIGNIEASFYDTQGMSKELINLLNL